MLVLGGVCLLDRARERCERSLLVPYAFIFYLQCRSSVTDDCSILLHLQICPYFVDGSSPDWVRRVLYRCRRDSELTSNSGAQIIFRSFLQPVFSKYFSQSGSTAADLRSKADQATKSQ